MRIDPEIIAETPADALSSVLESIRLRSHFFGLNEMVRPWGVVIGRQPSIIFHVQIEGRSELELDGGAERVWLEAGDVALITHGHPHTLRHGPSAHDEPLEALLARASRPGTLRNRPGPTSERFLCGGFTLEDGLSHPLLRALPDLIVLPPVGREPWLESTLQFIASEAAHGAAGASTVIRRLVDVLLIQCFRQYFRQNAGSQGGAPSWIRGLGDPQLARALTAIHRAPEKPWTVEQLAAEAGLSRSGFAARFSLLVGQTPAEYLTAWRMHRGAELLRKTQLGLAEISLRAGYESEAAFSRAFRRVHGIAPGRFRRLDLARAS
ncbi:MAG: AraC family transcriptional regulator [Acidobacteria bacterium]|nr:AraC family transcriptional regulator [Acidobacteriota bacterium]